MMHSLGAVMSGATQINREVLSHISSYISYPDPHGQCNDVLFGYNCIRTPRVISYLFFSLTHLNQTHGHGDLMGPKRLLSQHSTIAEGEGYCLMILKIIFILIFIYFLITL